MSKAKTLLAGSLLAASTLTSSIALADSPLTANIAVTNNYIFRGVTQTNDQAAVQGGIDYSHDSGFYVGAWTSNVAYGSATNYELDLYLGYGLETGAFSHDFGLIGYLYPVGPVQADYYELYYNFGWQWLSAGLAYTISKEDSNAKTNDLYYYVGGDWEIGSKGLGFGFVVGRYDFQDGSTADYNYLNLHLTKDDFTLALDKNDTDEIAWGVGSDDVRISVSWGKTFDLL